VAGADREPVKIEAVDARLIRNRVGQWFTNDPVAITATNDPVPVLKRAVEDELVNRGFRLSDKGIVLAVQLEKLYGTLSASDWAGQAKDSTATAEISVRIKKSDGTILYSTAATGQAEKPKLTSKADATALFADALQDCLARLFANPSFVNALLSASPH
jgi:uncharacterized lipoprotein YajG